MVFPPSNSSRYVPPSSGYDTRSKRARKTSGEVIPGRSEEGAPRSDDRKIDVFYQKISPAVLGVILSFTDITAVLSFERTSKMGRSLNTNVWRIILSRNCQNVTWSFCATIENAHERYRSNCISTLIFNKYAKSRQTSKHSFPGFLTKFNGLFDRCLSKLKLNDLLNYFNYDLEKIKHIQQAPSRRRKKIAKDDDQSSSDSDRVESRSKKKKTREKFEIQKPELLQSITVDSPHAGDLLMRAFDKKIIYNKRSDTWLPMLRAAVNAGATFALLFPIFDSDISQEDYRDLAIIAAQKNDFEPLDRFLRLRPNPYQIEFLNTLPRLAPVLLYLSIVEKDLIKKNELLDEAIRQYGSHATTQVLLEAARTKLRLQLYEPANELIDKALRECTCLRFDIYSIVETSLTIKLKLNDLDRAEFVVNQLINILGGFEKFLDYYRSNDGFSSNVVSMYVELYVKKGKYKEAAILAEIGDNLYKKAMSYGDSVNIEIPFSFLMDLFKIEVHFQKSHEDVMNAYDRILTSSLEVPPAIVNEANCRLAKYRLNPINPMMYEVYYGEASKIYQGVAPTDIPLDICVELAEFNFNLCKYKEANLYCEQALATYKDSAPIFLLLWTATIKFYFRQISEADALYKKVFTKIKKDFSGFAKVRYEVIYYLTQFKFTVDKDMAAAEPFFDLLMTNHRSRITNRFDIFEQFITLKFKLNKHQETALLISDIIKTGGDRVPPSIFVYQAEAALELLDFEKALTSIEQALKRYQAVIRTSRSSTEAIVLREKYALALAKAAKIHLKGFNIEKAYHSINQSISEYGTTDIPIEVLALAAEIKVRIRIYSEATPFINRSLAIYADHVPRDFLEIAAQHRFHIGEYREAERFLNKALEIDGDNANDFILGFMADVQVKLKRIELAKKFYLRAANKFPQEPRYIARYEALSLLSK